MSDIKNALNWRYATKRYLKDNIIEQGILDEILESIRMAPTSLGMQPFKAYVIQNQQIREKLSPACYNQPQILESSVVIVFAAINDLSHDDIEAHLVRIASTRNIPIESLEGFRKSIHNFTQTKTVDQIKDWASKQTYIALGFALLAAAQHQVDSTPMEGFNPSLVDEILELDQQNLHATVILTLGKRDEDADFLSKAIKVRKSTEELFVHL